MNQRERQPGDLPDSDPAELEKAAEKSREELDAVPEPGTDPLHEGP